MSSLAVSLPTVLLRDLALRAASPQSCLHSSQFLATLRIGPERVKIQVTTPVLVLKQSLSQTLDVRKDCLQGKVCNGHCDVVSCLPCQYPYPKDSGTDRIQYLFKQFRIVDVGDAQTIRSGARQVVGGCSCHICPSGNCSLIRPRRLLEWASSPRNVMKSLSRRLTAINMSFCMEC